MDGSIPPPPPQPPQAPQGGAGVTLMVSPLPGVEETLTPIVP
jgi:hypothetical protein